MWVLFALLSAGFAGINAILAKCGTRKVDSTLATALRTVVVLGVSFGAVAVTGGWRDLLLVRARSCIFLALSGVLTGASWLCYFRALSAGDVNRVAAVDKFSTILTMLGGWILLGEPMNLKRAVSMGLMAIGIALMIDKKSNVIDKVKSAKRPQRSKGGWLLWAILSVLLVSAATLLSKIGVRGISSELALAVRTGVVLIMTWVVALCGGKTGEIGNIDRKSMLFIGLSGLATGLGWVCYFRALVKGDAGAVHPVDKLSILVTVILSRLFFGERLSRRAAQGLALLTGGILVLLWDS